MEGSISIPSVKIKNRITKSGLYWNKRYYRWRDTDDYNRKGIDVLEENWDNLIILDACRFDLFSECNTIGGELEYRTSRASNTKQFIKANFRERELLDTAYISDNVWYGRLYEDIGSIVYDYQTCARDAFDGAVSHPETVTDSAIEFVQDNDDKRCIVHYLQPHAPYFDEDGDQLFALESKYPADLRAAGYSRADIRAAYTSNLKLVLCEVERLLPHLEGKTVVTADHGELLGERLFPVPVRMYEHPSFVYVDHLVKVPWLVIDGEKRKEIRTASSPRDWEYSEIDDAEIQEQLEKLGYL